MSVFLVEYPLDSSYTCLGSSAFRFPHERHSKESDTVTCGYTTISVNFIVKLIGQLFNDAVYVTEVI